MTTGNVNGKVTLPAEKNKQIWYDRGTLGLMVGNENGKVTLQAEKNK